MGKAPNKVVSKVTRVCKRVVIGLKSTLTVTGVGDDEDEAGDVTLM